MAPRGGSLNFPPASAAAATVLPSGDAPVLPSGDATVLPSGDTMVASVGVSMVTRPCGKIRSALLSRTGSLPDEPSHGLSGDADEQLLFDTGSSTPWSPPPIVFPLPPARQKLIS